MGDVFASSDSVRSNRPLRYVREVTFDQPLALARGGTLPAVTVAYETYGRLNAQRSNAVLVCHAISGDSHVAGHDEADDPGWWELMVGPGKPIDTDQYFVVCSNVLGGCRGTTGPGSVNPATGLAWGPDFPLITVEDMVDVQRKLQQHLGIDQWLITIGGSLGGHQAMTWAVRYPDAVRGCAAVATSPRLTSQALAFDIVARNAIQRDPYFHEGRYYFHQTKPDVGLAIARMLGHITYLSPEAMGAKFDLDRHEPRDLQTVFEKRFSVGSYLAYQGHKFVERFDANSYVTISLAMDMFDMGATHEALMRTFEPASCDWQVISFSSDWLFTPSQSRDIVNALLHNDKRVSYCEVQSDAGHDGFLLDDEISRYGRIIAAFLQRLAGADQVAASSISTAPQAPRASAEDQTAQPVGIFRDRLDIDTILSLISTDESVLDLGCGQGDLLYQLKQRGHARLMGIEVAEANLIACARKGVDVIDHDVNTALTGFRDQQFDVVVLSQTLQAVWNVQLIINEMLRVGRRAIVCFPNFAYRPLREMFWKEGRSPKTSGLYHYEWYNTPNRRFPSIRDFDLFCQQQNVRIARSIYLDSEQGKIIVDDPNLNADSAVYVLTR